MEITILFHPFILIFSLKLAKITIYIANKLIYVNKVNQNYQDIYWREKIIYKTSPSIKILHNL